MKNASFTETMKEYLSLHIRMDTAMLKYFALVLIVLSACQEAPKKNKVSSTLFANGLTLHKTTVVYFLNAECPICQKYQGSFKSTYQKFSKYYNFQYVFSGPHSEQAIKDFCAYDSIPYNRIVVDDANNIAHTMRATTTPQVLIIADKESNTYLYSGKIDDRFESISSQKPQASINYIEKALISLQKNEPIEISETIPVGCFIEPD